MSRTLIAAMTTAMSTALTAATLLVGLGAQDASAAGWGPDHREPPRMERDHRGPNAHRPESHRPPPPVHRAARHWKPGDRLPAAYAARRHVIATPAAYHLHRPPRGHHWVRAGSDAVLVASRSGIMVRIVPGLFR
ncbi:RcnB family protein [Azospirillum formosense]|uniref:RcnB family protein n=1 Tax=Azospirillum formosense TaxID=861533 RepID=UPI00338EBEB3